VWREDYVNTTLYRISEFRMGMSFYGFTGLKIFGLTVNGSGGDGLYFGNDGVRAGGNVEDAHVKDCVFDRNTRQGMSISSGAINVLIENCTFSNTAGHAPAYGVDIEPDHATNVFRNLTFRNCRAVNNEHAGFALSPPLLVYDKSTHAFSHPTVLDITFEDCLVDNRGQVRHQWADDMGAFIMATFPPMMTGTVDINRLTVLGGVTPGIQAWSVGSSVSVTIRNLQLIDVAGCGQQWPGLEHGPPYVPRITCDTWLNPIVNNSRNTKKCIPSRPDGCQYWNAPITIRPMWGGSLANLDYPYGGLHFENVSIVYNGSMPVVLARAFSEEAGLADLTGSIRAVVTNVSSCRLDLDSPGTHKKNVSLALSCAQRTLTVKSDDVPPQTDDGTITRLCPNSWVCDNSPEAQPFDLYTKFSSTQ
jgi:hypothetical protein